MRNTEQQWPITTITRAFHFDSYSVTFGIDREIDPTRVRLQDLNRSSFCNAVEEAICHGSIVDERDQTESPDQADQSEMLPNPSNLTPDDPGYLEALLEAFRNTEQRWTTSTITEAFHFVRNSVTLGMDRLGDPTTALLQDMDRTSICSAIEEAIIHNTQHGNPDERWRLFVIYYASQNQDTSEEYDAVSSTASSSTQDPVHSNHDQWARHIRSQQDFWNRIPTTGNTFPSYDECCDIYDALYESSRIQQEERDAEAADDYDSNPTGIDYEDRMHRRCRLLSGFWRGFHGTPTPEQDYTTAKSEGYSLDYYEQSTDHNQFDDPLCRKPCDHLSQDLGNNPRDDTDVMAQNFFPANIQGTRQTSVPIMTHVQIATSCLNFSALRPASSGSFVPCAHQTRANQTMQRCIGIAEHRPYLKSTAYLSHCALCTCTDGVSNNLNTLISCRVSEPQGRISCIDPLLFKNNTMFLTLARLTLTDRTLVAEMDPGSDSTNWTDCLTSMNMDNDYAFYRYTDGDDEESNEQKETKEKENKAAEAKEREDQSHRRSAYAAGKGKPGSTAPAQNNDTVVTPEDPWRNHTSDHCPVSGEKYFSGSTAPPSSHSPSPMQKEEIFEEADYETYCAQMGINSAGK